MPIKMTTKKKSVASTAASPAAGVELTAQPDASKMPEQIDPAIQHVAQVLADLHDNTPELTPDPPVVASAPIATTPAVPTVMVTLPFKGQSKQFLEVMIGDKQGWLGKDSLVSFEIAGDVVEIEMTRALAKRRKILQAA